MARSKVTTERGAKRTRVFMVELFVDMPDTPPITFFGSKKAIFEYFGNKKLGLSYSSSRCINFAENHYQNRICRIEEGVLLTLGCNEVIERRTKEGRSEIPQSNPDGANKLGKQG